MIEYVEKEVKRFEKVELRTVCDGCKKEIDKKVGYFRVCTSHNDWGNDSIDSYEHYDFCCPACLFKFAEPYVSESYNNRFNTREIDIEHMRGYIT